MAAKKKVTEPIMECPFTGEKLELVCSDNLYWMARGPFWNTKLYKSRYELLHDISHRGGKAPDFSREAPKIEVRDNSEPEPNPNADLVVGEEQVNDMVDKVIGDS